jgi:glycosyltransferase involved in cell wall biosynthesis
MRVLHVQYTNPGAYPPLVRGAQLLAERGAHVLMLGTRVRSLDPLDPVPVPRITVRLAPAADAGWRLKAHYARYAAWVAREAAVWRPDWIYASDLLSAPIALAVASFTHSRIVYHEHDAPAHERPSWAIRRSLDARLRLVQRADAVVAPNAERAARLSALAGGRHVFTVWNCPLRPAHPPRRSASGDTLRVIFRGSVNPERLPLTVIDAIAVVERPVTLDVAAYETAGSRGYLAALATRAADRGVGDRVRLLGIVPDLQLSSVSERSDVGLALMPMAAADENMRHMTGASNKVFEYLSCGVAPMVSDLPDWRRTFVDPGYAFACDPTDVASVAAQLRWAANHRDALRDIAARGWKRLTDDWNYESQFAPVLDVMFGHDKSASLPDAAILPDEAACAL